MTLIITVLMEIIKIAMMIIFREMIGFCGGELVICLGSLNIEIPDNNNKQENRGR